MDCRCSRAAGRSHRAGTARPAMRSQARSSCAVDEAGQCLAGRRRPGTPGPARPRPVRRPPRSRDLPGLASPLLAAPPSAASSASRPASATSWCTQEGDSPIAVARVRIEIPPAGPKPAPMSVPVRPAPAATPPARPVSGLAAPPACLDPLADPHPPIAPAWLAPAGGHSSASATTGSPWPESRPWPESPLWRPLDGWPSSLRTARQRPCGPQGRTGAHLGVPDTRAPGSPTRTALQFPGTQSRRPGAPRRPRFGASKAPSAQAAASGWPRAGWVSYGGIDTSLS